MNWRELKMIEIFEGILNGDTPQYDFVDVDDLNDIGIDGDESDYEIETHINKSLLAKGYEWVEQEDGELALIK